MSTTTPRAREEILKLAVLKANNDFITYLYDELIKEYKNEGWDLETTLRAGYGKAIWFIFLKDFARAFWGDEGCCLYCGKTKINDTGHCPVHDVIDFYDYPYPIWQYHRHKMLDENDPISYLEQFL